MRIPEESHPDGVHRAPHHPSNKQKYSSYHLETLRDSQRKLSVLEFDLIIDLRAIRFVVPVRLPLRWPCAERSQNNTKRDGKCSRMASCCCGMHLGLRQMEMTCPTIQTRFDQPPQIRPRTSTPCEFTDWGSKWTNVSVSPFSPTSTIPPGCAYITLSHSPVAHPSPLFQHPWTPTPPRF